MSDIKRNERRKKHYQMLRDAGYDRETATRLKDYNLKTVESVCKVMLDAKQDVNQIDQQVAEHVKTILRGKRK